MLSHGWQIHWNMSENVKFEEKPCELLQRRKDCLRKLRSSFGCRTDKFPFYVNFSDNNGNGKIWWLNKERKERKHFIYKYSIHCIDEWCAYSFISQRKETGLSRRALRLSKWQTSFNLSSENIPRSWHELRQFAASFSSDNINF